MMSIDEMREIVGQCKYAIDAIVAILSKRLGSAAVGEPKPIDMLLFCPNCWEQHIDAEESETDFQHKMEAF